MDSKTKIEFSAEEASLMQDAGFILTKNRIIEKLYDVFGGLSLDYTEVFGKVSIPAEVMSIPAKISKGENYRGLPFVILDYPRFFSKEDVFAVRTMFWWGNYFSITLHLKGVYREMYRQKIQDGYDLLAKEDFCISLHEDEWQHHFDEYYPFIKNITRKEFDNKAESGKFVKIASAVSLQSHEMIREEMKRKAELLARFFSH